MKADKRRKPRWLQQLRAWLGGYFWLPCPICGEYFGGHEWSTEKGATWWQSPGPGKGVCDNCIVEAARRSVVREMPPWEVLPDGTWVFHIDGEVIEMGGDRFGL